MSVHFPKGAQFAPVELGNVGADLPLADVTAYSMDDSSTIEVDYALSVSEQDGDFATIGIHIAAPGLAVTRDSDLDKLARSRMSTVYRSEEHTTEPQSSMRISSAVFCLTTNHIIVLPLVLTYSKPS